ncbi:phage/plasmid primase, P4 family [Saccharopolyspora hattusasensis]|uniref:phage/plasmid primase, P4 family n=1 Tax=Saccharopolyspora hattusasensis TaxID=1128679 RepID=UPI003D95B1C4
MEQPSVLSAAVAWAQAGASVVQARADGTKGPVADRRDPETGRWTWKHYQHERPERATLEAWFADGHPGIGVVCGAVSGNLEMLELEGRAYARGWDERLHDAMQSAGVLGIWARITGGYYEFSPSGGAHFYWRVADEVPARNTKLARDAAGDVMIETRGEGGFVVVAPSHGPVHPSGRAWTVGNGTPGVVATITAAERDELFRACMSLDESPMPEPIPDIRERQVRAHGDGSAPGADFNERGTWDFLRDHGWTPLHTAGARTFWNRPGAKNRRGVDAVTGGERGDYLCVWSTSVPEFTPETAYSKWRAYAILAHAGDFPAAATALAADGYGTPKVERPHLTSIPLGSTVEGATVTAGAPEPIGDADSAPLGDPLAQTDDGNALLLIDTFGDRIRYCSERGKWLHWTGKRWEWCNSDAATVREYAKRVARCLPETDKDEIKWKRTSLGLKGIVAMVSLAASDPRVAVSVDDLDARPRELNTPGGIVDLVTGRLMPHDPSRMHTRITSVAPDFDADTATWDKFIGDTFGDDNELVTYVQRLLGYMATGEVRDHILPFAFGAGGNGKGVLLESLLHVLGDYGRKVSKKLLLSHNGSDHPTILAQLQGVRFALASEVNDGDKFDEGQVKELTGGDRLSARFMGKDFFDFDPSHKIMLMGNAQPDVSSGGGHSFWRRLRLIPFTRTVSEENRIDDLQGILAREHGGAVLAWVIRGAVDYYAGGLTKPESMVKATETYSQAEDSVGSFVADMCTTGPAGGRIPMSKLRQAYETWCKSAGMQPVTNKRFGMDLVSRFGVGKDRDKSARYYTGITCEEPDGDRSMW